MTSGADTTAMLKAILAGDDFPPEGVPDTPATRQAWADIAQSVEDLPAGVIPEIPPDWADWADDGSGEPPPKAG
jgi:hypothetical protein